ncbi:hypothetical protein A2631_00075 [Candidatus Daviesbacteria bacterium RIFCSPHIGHO2_01_FULL_44_29]|uniref:ABC transporter ATP-binding protein n=1 Tax=Candidatus Daviesbacteria bacterium RIFCSPHIGHO2_02_FULL_43_12 TaxID=1797776 RepID=A0A1F5KI57_9BACT|nr:MAG: hypothetical protein A2631_00075 [Candidatus Daviesbacteria bacterium RIFCSPHIGHO2_01_FULL_44_29]OGE40568.1 MAG: hypothetical protein A3D25_00420 [Candidatus Daviesbacteria bacterium RIFCSPHIGHO2_02_FULL_43_12]OGE70128.1 MAG: hypothetical protein A3B55_00190 [Candidatus Daviesbacteria bacterium RIFCSPLOWO2_01_FULL_43_15]
MRQSKKVKSFNLVQKIWFILRPFHRAFLGIFIITAFFETIRLGGPYLFGRILDLLITSKGQLSLQVAAAVIAGLAGIRVISLIIDYLTDISIFRLLYQAEHFVSKASFSKLLELSMDYHEKENTGTKINIVNKGTDKIIELVGAFTWELQPIVLQLVVTIVLILLTSWPIGIVFSLSLIPFMLITHLMFRMTRPLREKRYDAYELSSGEIGDTVTNITVVKAFAQERREEESFSGIWDVIRGLSKREFTTHTMVGYTRGMLVETFYIILLCMGIWQIKSGLLTVGSLVFLISLVERAYSNVYRLGRIYNRAMDASEPADRVSNLLAQTPSIKNHAQAVTPAHIEGQVSFKHVSFAYKRRRVLRNISFTIPKGSFTALVGKSGSGKSTIAKLISRYYDPTSGSIVIDGKLDLKTIDLDTFRRSTAVVFQDSPVPNRQIWEVISYAAGKVTFDRVKDQVVRAAQLAHAHEFIMEFDEGYHTPVGERGVKLSGGQKQRLAIARALFAEPSILIMDEPTSHLDALSENQIQKALEGLSKERSFTKIVIAHRLSTVQHADQILVMDRGRLIERGNHRQLLAKGGIYADIVKQSEVIKS